MADLRILVIDDNESIHRDFIKILTPTNNTAELDVLSAKLFNKKEKIPDISLPPFEIATASQGQEGVRKIKEALDAGHPFALAFVDIRMPPGWDGIETIKHIWQLDADIQIVICTAYSDYTWEETVINLGKTDNLLILKKPFDQIAVRQLACALTKKWELMLASRRYNELLKKQIEDKTQSLQHSLSLIKATLESSNDGILVLSNEGKVIEHNQKLLNLWGIPDNIIESKEENILLEFMQKQLINPDNFLKKIKTTPVLPNVFDIEVIHFKDGRVYECFTQPQILKGKIVGRVINFHDITKRARLEKELQYLATHDPLTKLPNRYVLIEKIRELIKSSKDTKKGFAILFCDLDRFKLINDSLSHAAGDEILKNIASRLNNTIFDSELLVRIGGDEFVIIIPQTNDTAYIINRANKILNAFSKPFNISDRHIELTASLGISLYPEHGTTTELLMHNADAAMYHAKEKGTNNFQFYNKEMTKHFIEQLDMEIQLREALENNEFFLCYQPQYEIDSKKMVAAEALIRWNHPEHGILLPIDFIPAAEKNGLIIPIGEWVIRTACAQNKKWQDEGLAPIRVAVNVTSKQFNQQQVVTTIKNVLQETKLEPQYLEIELTESTILSCIDVLESVKALKELGVYIAVDDFGTGYSSLDYLRKLPLNRLKIDSSFIQRINVDDKDEVLVRSFITIAKNLHLEVLAEGVENDQQLKFLKEQECNEIQGYYLSKPLSEKELKNLLTTEES